MMDTPGLEAPDRPNVVASTAAREAYFVDFAHAMKAELKTMPLMVTGGVRTRAGMAHALASGSADVIGIGRPLCVMPDDCRGVLAATGDLDRPEDRLALFPPWLGWVGRTKMGRAISGFGVQMWYYAQLDHLDHLGRLGEAKPAQSVFSAMRQVDANAKTWLAARAKAR